MRCVSTVPASASQPGEALGGPQCRQLPVSRQKTRAMPPHPTALRAAPRPCGGRDACRAEAYAGFPRRRLSPSWGR
eukprot:6098318-Pyramimonas_sp.AAC.1